MPQRRKSPLELISVPLMHASEHLPTVSRAHSEEEGEEQLHKLRGGCLSRLEGSSDTQLSLAFWSFP